MNFDAQKTTARRNKSLGDPPGEDATHGHDHVHLSHPAVVARLKRVSGHLKTAITMIEIGRPCAQLAQQLHAVEKAVRNAKQTLIRDHIDHCLDQDSRAEAGHAHDHLEEFKQITKYL